MRASSKPSAPPPPPVRLFIHDNPAARRTFWFAVLIFSSVVGIEGFLLTAGFPAELKHPELIGRLLGTLDAALLAALYYIFGSSAGSQRTGPRHDDKEAKP